MMVREICQGIFFTKRLKVHYNCQNNSSKTILKAEVSINVFSSHLKVVITNRDAVIKTRGREFQTCEYIICTEFDYDSYLASESGT